MIEMSDLKGEFAKLGFRLLNSEIGNDQNLLTIIAYESYNVFVSLTRR